MNNERKRKVKIVEQNYKQLKEKIFNLLLKEATKKGISKMLMKMDSKIGENLLSRALRLAKDYKNTDKPELKSNNSIASQKLDLLNQAFDMLFYLEDHEFIKLFKDASGDRRKANQFLLNVTKDEKQLYLYQGEYACFNMDLVESKILKESTLKLSKPQNRVKSNTKTQFYKAYLKAEYTSYTQYSYEGDCIIRNKSLYIKMLREDGEEEVFFVSNIGLRNSTEVPLVVMVNGTNVNMIPVASLRLLVKKSYVEEYREAIKTFLSNSLSVYKVPSWEEISNSLKEITSISKLKFLEGTTYTSYNMYGPNSQKVCKNVWYFEKSTGKLKVKRKGANDEEFEGFATYYHNNLFCELTNKNVPIKKRYYILSLERYLGINEDFKYIESIGLILNARDTIIAGKEILVKSEIAYDQSEVTQIPIFEAAQEEKSIFPYLNNHDNAIYRLKYSDGDELPPKFEGQYYVYYLHSETRNLVRNIASIQIITIGNLKIPWIVYNSVRGDQYETMSISYRNDKDRLYMRFKDKYTQEYFVFHLQHARIQNQTPPSMLLGTTSCISYHLNRPKAAAIVFLKISENINISMSTINVLGEIKSYDDFSENESIIKTYLYYMSVNPLNVIPYKDMEDLKSNLPQIKGIYFQNLMDNILYNIAPKIRESNERFITGLIKIISSISKDESVIFESEHIHLFRIFFEEILRSYTGSRLTFYSTSLARKRYFWYPNNNTEEVIEQFVNAGGVSNRIFFVRSSDAIPDQEEYRIIRRHFEIYGQTSSKGKVFVAPMPETAPQLFSTEDYGYISWKVKCDMVGSIEQLKGTTDNKVHLELVGLFEKYMQNSTTIPVDQKHIEAWEASLY